MRAFVNMAIVLLNEFFLKQKLRISYNGQQQQVHTNFSDQASSKQPPIRENLGTGDCP
jgi:hypothetical protein